MALFIATAAAAGFLNHSDAGACGKLAHSRRKIDVLIIHHEPEDAPACTAPEAMKSLATWAHCEGRRFLLMKRAKRFEIRACALQWKIRTDHFDDIVRGGDLLDCFRRDTHARLSIFASFAFGSDGKLTQCGSISNV